jgi:hypothetical protein
VLEMKPQIFVSHSQKDKDTVTYFDRVFARTGVKSVCMEFEKMRSPQWQSISDAVGDSDAIFLLLGTNVKGNIHTQNWIAFEVGLSCAFRKDVWVFEREDSDIDFPIPYLTDFMMYNPQESETFDYVRSVIDAYGKEIEGVKRGRFAIKPLFTDLRAKRNVPKGIPIKCSHCQSEYNLHAIVALSFHCPSCRKLLSSF